MYGPLIFNAAVLIVLFFFYFKDKDKTQKAMRLASEHFKKIMPLLIIMLAVIIFMQGAFSEENIAGHITAFSGTTGYLIAAFIGGVIHIPPFITFPLAGQLLQNGVNPGVIAVLVTSLIMVHSFTIPLEAKEMGIKFALARNILCLISAIMIGIVVGVLY